MDARFLIKKFTAESASKIKFLGLYHNIAFANTIITTTCLEILKQWNMKWCKSRKNMSIHMTMSEKQDISNS